jgi:hypothetical protein
MVLRLFFDLFGYNFHDLCMLILRLQPFALAVIYGLKPYRVWKREKERK